MSWWGSNPFDELVEKATSELLPAGQENLALNLEISDEIRSKKVNPKDAMRSLKERLSHKNPNVQLATLSLVDTCVKNSGDMFLREVATREFMDSLVSVLKSSACNVDVRDRLLSIIQTWGTASRNNPRLSYMHDTYTLLKAEGMTFPPMRENLDSIFLETAAHHCRRCGGTFCQQCSAKSLPLPQLGINEPVRVCDGCYIKVKLEKVGSKPASTPPSNPVTLPSVQPPSASDNNEFDDDIKKAIELSLKEAEQQKNSYGAGFVKLQPRQETSVADEDPDLAAAIAASLNDLNISNQEAPRDVLSSSEMENILLFSTLIDRIAAKGGDVSSDPQVNQLYTQIGTLHPKLVKDLDETIRKRNMFIELHQKLNAVVKAYDQVLEERIAQHQPSYASVEPYYPHPSLNTQEQHYQSYYQHPPPAHAEQHYSSIPAQPAQQKKADDAPLIEL
ncbi:hypothetical protein BY458DRAFT_576088 [Sporodiniella umbellata]|nr:hypothetical protein BY458DRAFT_576088 [Sporodiniella umbellata]